LNRALRYFFDEALASLWRGYKTGLIAAATISTAFVVLGGFLILTTNLERTISRWQEAAEFSVYLTDSVTPAQRAAVEKLAHDHALVAAVEVVTRDQALQRFTQNFAALAEAAGDLPSNPLPESVEVRLRPGASPSDVESLAQQLRSAPGVADVRYDRQWIQRLMNAVGVVRAVGFALAGVLMFAAGLTVASVVRLALVARREEIHIMQLVGAPLAYIKGPFVVEGLIQGGVGATVALIVLWIGLWMVRSRAGTWLEGTIDPTSLGFLSLGMSAALLAAGMVVGSLGGLIAAQSTRETHD
jgi:cell division transport system permease protein